MFVMSQEYNNWSRQYETKKVGPREKLWYKLHKKLNIKFVGKYLETISMVIKEFIG